MIKSTLRKLRRKPKAFRNTVSMATASILTGMIALVWLYNTPAKFSELGASVATTDDSQPGFMQMFGGVGSQLATVKESLKELQETTKTDLESGGPATVDSVDEMSTDSDTVPVATEQSSATTTAKASASSSPSVTTTPRSIRIVTVNNASGTSLADDE